jgi:anion-transporting  ArsA/GET3 family ATPase
MDRLLDQLFSRQLIINMGKGGVGKSTITAMLARLAAERGKRVLVCEINAKERMHQLLGGTRPDLNDSLDHIWKIQERIEAVNIQPAPAMKEYVVQVLKMGLLYNLIFENRTMRYFLRAVPGLQELVFAGKIWYHVEEDKLNKAPRFDLVIVDAPSTGHGLAMLRIAKVVLETIPVGPMHQAAQKIQAMLQDPKRTCVNLITLPEEMPTHESIELAHKIRDELGIPLGALFMNQWPRHPLDLHTTQHPLQASPHEAYFNAFAKLAEEDDTLWPYAQTGKAALRRIHKARGYLTTLLTLLQLPTWTLPRLVAAQTDDQREMVNQLATTLVQQKPLRPEDIPPSSSLPAEIDTHEQDA